MSLFEHSFYIGNAIGCILYGIDVVMYYMTVQNTVKSKTASRRKRFMTFFMSTTFLFFLSIELAANSVNGEQAWITFRHDETAWLKSKESARYEAVATAALAFLIVLSDAFQIYRFYLFYGSRLCTLIFPCIIFSATVALAIMEDIVAAQSSFFSERAIKFGIPYYCLSISLNMYTTSAIVWRIMRMSSGLGEILGSQVAEKYTSITSLFIESAALYSLFGIAMIIPYALKHPTAPVFGLAWSKLAAICPQLIMLRLSSGTGWNKDTIARVQSDIIFLTTINGQVEV